MPSKSDPKFQMRMDNKGTDSLFAEERNDLKLEKLTQKVTIITILIPVLIGVILIISYLDIKSLVSTVKDTGESGVQSLSQNLESRFSTLSVKFAALEATFSKKIDQMTKNQLALQNRVKEAEKSVRWLNKVKAGKKTFEEKSADFETHLATLRRDLQTLDSNLNSLDQSVKKEISDLVALVEKSETTLIGFQAQIAEKIDREEAGKLIGKQKQTLLASLEALGLRLEKQIVLNRQKIAAIKETAGAKAPPPPVKPKSGKTPASPTSPKAAATPAPVPKQAGKSEKSAAPAPKPGQIVEQDL
jgi:DNA repair exonuclease SbcCD ATPase subunit